MSDIVEQARNAYNLVKEWPERRGDPMEVGGAGFMDLLALRNLVPALLAEITSLRERVGELEKALAVARAEGMERAARIAEAAEPNAESALNDEEYEAYIEARERIAIAIRAAAKEGKNE